MDKLTALVLAGTRAQGDPLSTYAGVSHKALIDIGGRAMIDRVVSAVAAVPQVARIAIAIERPEVLRGLDALSGAVGQIPVEVIPAAAGPSASAAAAMERYGAPLLVTTADHALLRPEWITDFLERVPRDCDVAALLASRKAILAALPNTQRTYLRFADGEWSGCNLFLLATARASGGVHLWQTLEAERKRPLKLVGKLGIGFALRYRFHLLKLAQALARFETLCGARLNVVESRFGLAAVDVDKPGDLDLVRALVNGERAATDATIGPAAAGR